MTSHDLKCWIEFFEEISTRRKKFELRKNDRGFAVGDTLILREWNNASKTYTGRIVARTVTYLLEHKPDAECAANYGLAPEYVIMSLDDAR